VCVCVCVCVSMCAHVCACICVCVCEGVCERGRVRKTERGRVCACATMWVCGCVCVCHCVCARTCVHVCVWSWIVSKSKLFRDHITLVQNHITIVRAHVIFVEVLPFYVVTVIWVQVLRMVCRLAVFRAVSIFSAISAALAPAFAFFLKICRYAFQNMMHVGNAWNQVGK